MHYELASIVVLLGVVGGPVTAGGVGMDRASWTGSPGGIWTWGQHLSQRFVGQQLGLG